MKSYRIYIGGTFFGSALARDENHVLEMMDMKIREKGVDGESEEYQDFDWIWKEVKQD